MAQRSNYPVTIKVIPPLGQKGPLAGQFRQVCTSRALISMERHEMSGCWHEARVAEAFPSPFYLNCNTKKTNQHPNLKLKQQTRKIPLNLDRFRSIQTRYLMQIVTTLLCCAISTFDAFLCMVWLGYFFFSFFGTACKFCDFFSKYRVQNTLGSGGEGECLTAQQALWGYSLSYWDELNNSPLIYTPVKLACWQVHN